MFRTRRFYISLLGAVVCSVTAVESILDILDAASLSAVHSSLVGLAGTASAFEVVALGAVTVFSAQYAWTREGIIKDSPQATKLLAIACVLLCAGALIISLTSIIIIRSRLPRLDHASNGRAISDSDSQSSAHIAIWVLACLCQSMLFSSPLWNKPRQHVQPVVISGPRDSVMSEMRYSTTTPNLYMMEPTQPSSPLGALPSPTLSIRSSHSLKSWRESLQQVVRPVTSRSKLTGRSSFNRDVHSSHSDGLSVQSATQVDGFDSWEVDAQSKDVVAQLASASLLAPSRGTALEPIPGSRPASPARALDGPFPIMEDEELPPPPKLALDTSRPPSPAGSEAHIHPLFRSESPTPPPAATPGTSIVASPLANQVITCPVRPYSRMRSSSSLSNSRGASPNPLVHSRSFISERATSRLSKRSHSRSPSPPSRQITPPIPDFVLNSSPRSSLSGSQRKVNLRIETAR